MDVVTPSGVTVTAVHLVHEVLAPPVDQEGPPTMQWRIACMPNMTEFHQTAYHPNYQRSDDARAVSCPACQKTPAFKAAQKRTGQR